MFKHIPRIFVGFILVITGVAKVLDLPGFADVVASYQLISGVPAVVIAYALPFLEIGLGIWLFSKISLLVAAWLAVGMHVFYFSLAGVTLWRGIDIPNCGCFGVFFARPLGINTLFEDAFMICVAGLIVFHARSPQATHVSASTDQLP